MEGLAAQALDLSSLHLLLGGRQQLPSLAFVGFLWNTLVSPNHSSAEPSAKLNYFSILDSFKVSPMIIIFFNLEKRTGSFSFSKLHLRHHYWFSLNQWFSYLREHQHHLEGLLNYWSSSRVSDSTGLRWGLSTCIARSSQGMEALLAQEPQFENHQYIPFISVEEGDERLWVFKSERIWGSEKHQVIFTLQNKSNPILLLLFPLNQHVSML